MHEATKLHVVVSRNDFPEGLDFKFAWKMPETMPEKPAQIANAIRTVAPVPVERQPLQVVVPRNPSHSLDL